MAPDDRLSADRLDSWKEIAAYLGREVRTVQGWEKTEGLPVHRHQHGRQGSVYAFKSELTAWRASRRETPEAPAASEAESPVPTVTRKLPLWPIVATLGVVVAGALGYW